MSSKIICYFPGSGATTVWQNLSIHPDFIRVEPMSNYDNGHRSLVDVGRNDLDTIPHTTLFPWLMDVLDGFEDHLIFLPACNEVFAWLDEKELAHYLVIPDAQQSDVYLNRWKKVVTRSNIGMFEEHLRRCSYHIENSSRCRTIQLTRGGVVKDALPEIMHHHDTLVRSIINQIDWVQLSVYQMAHDMTFHPDIYFKSNPDKMSHYALHFAKYMGRVWDPQIHPITKTMTDTLSILLGVAYALKIDLGQVIYKPVPTASFREIYTKAAGQVCGAYLALIGDRVDHFDTFGSDALDRETLVNALCRLRDVAIDILVFNGYYNPVQAYHQALKKTREKHIAYDYLNNQYTQCLAVLLKRPGEPT